MTGSVHHPHSAAEYNKLVADAGSKLVVVDYSAEWCGPCKMIGPHFTKLSEQYNNAVFIHVDIDELGEVAADVSSVPTFKFFKNGSEVHKFSGANVKALESAVTANI
eukprot:TRINITY_DN95_c0_g1_i1.p1 TRINITY_DN95_c0_g1~~TRINITY_DN95_c0_g1_i1.p1  ORF type:complete len:119 (+),score=28.37 TRINITY_DN95_c0_g1_i1:38-358(+)